MTCFAKVDGVNFRRDPSMNADILGIIYGDEKLTILDDSSNPDWLGVYRPKTRQGGWISKSSKGKFWCDSRG